MAAAAAASTKPSPATPVVNCPGNNWGRGTLRANPVPATALVNRMRVALREWVMHGTPPPPSQWPTLAPLEDVVNEGRGRDDDDDDDDRRRRSHGARATITNSKWQPLLVNPTKEAMGFPSGVPGIPNSIFLAENFIFPVFDYNWGRDYDHSEANGVPTNAPPPIRHVIKMLVPRVDTDGNEMGGVPTVLNDAPLGTYLGWNITAGPGDGTKYDGRPFHAGQVCNYVGGMVPFAKTRAQRMATDAGGSAPVARRALRELARRLCKGGEEGCRQRGLQGLSARRPEAATDGSMPPQKSWHCRGARPRRRVPRTTGRCWSTRRSRATCAAAWRREVQPGGAVT